MNSEIKTTTIRFRSYPNADGSSRQLYIGEMVSTTPVQLVPEPTNKFDPNALAVFIPGNKQIGYVPREFAAYRAISLARRTESQDRNAQITGNVGRRHYPD